MTVSLLQISVVAVAFFVLRALVSSFSAPMNEAIQIMDFNGVQELLTTTQPDLVVIDVREKAEFDAGHIPNSLNMPFFVAPKALGLDELAFEKQLGFKKPSTDQTLLFYCRSGNRSKRAAATALEYGYEKVSNYPGSYQEWASLGGTTEK